MSATWLMELIGAFFRLIGLLLGLLGGLLGLLFSLLGRLLGGLKPPLLAALPLAVVAVVVGLLCLWQPLLWLWLWFGLGLGGYLLYRLARRRGYIEIRRLKPPRRS